MVLQKQIKELPLAGGIGEGIDDKVLPEGRMLELRNCYYDKPGSLRKRTGLRALPRDIVGGGELAEGRALDSYNDELLVMDGAKGYSASSDLGKGWVDKGKMPTARLDARIIRSSLNSTDNIDSWDGAAAGGYGVYVHAGGNTVSGAQPANAGPVIATVVDLETGAEVISNAQLDTEGHHPHVIFVKNRMMGVTWVDTTAAIVYYAYLENQGTLDVAFSAPRQLVTGLATTVNTSIYAAKGIRLAGPGASAPGSFAVASADGGGSLILIVLNEDGLTGVGGTLTAEVPLRIWLAVNDATPGSEQIFLYWTSIAATAVSLKYRVHSNIGNGLTGSTLIETYAAGEPGPSPITLSAVPDFTTPSSMVTYWGMATTTVGTANIWPFGASHTRTCLCTNAGGVSGIGVHSGGVSLYSDAFNYEGQHYYFAYHVSFVEPGTAFLIDGDGHVVTRFHVREGVPEGAGFVPTVRKVSDRGGGLWHVAAWRTVATALDVDTGGSTTVGDLVAVDVQLGASGQIPAILANESRMVGGGYLAGYDGGAFEESGFHYGPGELLNVTDGAGSMANDDYNVKAIYFWRDDNGNEQYSPLSIDTTALPVTVASGGITVQLMNYRRTQKTTVSILIYRTLQGALGGPYYLAARLANDPDTESQTVVLTLTDTQVSGTPTIYTTGGVLENTAPPKPHFVWSDGQTAFLIAADDKRSLWVSKPISSRLGVEWSGSLVARMPTGEALEAGGNIDGNVILFGRNSIRVLQGSRPTATGAGGYPESRPLSSEVGCIDYRSVTQFRGGIVFKSRHGISMLDRSLQVQYIGGPVEDHNDDTILATTVITRPGVGHIRFLLDTGEVLVWDYVTNAWGIYTEPDAVCCVNWQGHYASLRASGVALHKLDRDYYRDVGEPYAWGCRWPWIKASGLSGWQRTKRLHILGDYRSAHALDVAIYNDYDDSTPTLTQRFDSADRTWAAGPGSPYQARIRPPRQKASALTVDLTVDAPDGEGLRLTSLALDIGAKKGGAKLPSVASG